MVIKYPLLITILSVFLILHIVPEKQELKAQTPQFSQGVNWQKTIRVRGIMEDIDPFNETMLFDLTQRGTNEIEARPEFIQFQLVASNFWMVLRDSLQSAASSGRIDVHTVRESTQRGERGIFNAGTRVTYQDLLDTLSVALLDVFDPSDNFTQIHRGGPRVYDDLSGFVQFELRPNAQTVNGIERLVQDFSVFTMYELELVLHVDETGFVIIPRALLLGNAFWDSEQIINPDNLLDGFYARFDAGLGLFIDLTDSRTIQFLVDSGVQFSGENNMIPFFDLITLFQYSYKFYSESNNVIAENAADFGHDMEALEATLLNRYNDLTFTFLYGQPPSWWEDSGRGHFTNGLFEITEEMRRRMSGQEMPQEDDADF